MALKRFGYKKIIEHVKEKVECYLGCYNLLQLYKRWHVRAGLRAIKVRAAQLKSADRLLGALLKAFQRKCTELKIQTFSKMQLVQISQSRAATSMLNSLQAVERRALAGSFICIKQFHQAQKLKEINWNLALEKLSRCLFQKIQQRYQIALLSICQQKHSLSLFYTPKKARVVKFH